MTSERALSILPIRNNQMPNLSTKLGVCQVCGDKAQFINYGTLSCASCKTFFRRNGFRVEHVPVCCRQGKCPITIKTRKSCTACRFKKCLAVGMSPELIRKEDLHEKYRSMNKSKRKLASKEIVPLSKPYPLNLLSNDQSSLTATNWRLLSNVVHAFDTYNSVPDAQKIVNLISINSRNSPANVENSLNMMTLIYTSLQSFISSSADFRVLTTDEQCSLLQRNMQGLLAFYCIFTYRESGVFRNANNENALIPLYGYDNVQITKRISSQLDHDLTLIKLMLLTLTFSSTCFMIDEDDNKINDCLLFGTFRLFGSQNVYVELLWKYMTYRYGFFESAQRFSSMIKSALDGIKICSDIYESNKVHRNFADNIAEQCEHTLKLNSSENTPLWGKD